VTLINRISRIPSVWAALLLVLAYWFEAPFLENGYHAEWIRVAMIVFGGAVILTIAPAFRRMFLEDTPANAQQSLIGQILTLIGIVGISVWLLLWRAADFPLWMIKSDVNGFLLWTILIGAVFSLIAPKDHNRYPPRTRWPRVYGALALTIVLGYALVIIRPDVKPFVESLRPYLSSQ
jgi:hypothetical protein